MIEDSRGLRMVWSDKGGRAGVSETSKRPDCWVTIRGAGGKYLILPLGYTAPEGYIPLVRSGRNCLNIKHETATCAERIQWSKV